MNDPKDLTDITQRIEHLSRYMNSGPAAEGSAKYIDENYVIINRSSLPTIGFGSLDEAFAGDNYARLEHITEDAHGGDTKKMRNFAYQYLVMADYIDGKNRQAEQEELRANRYEAWKILYPESTITEDAFRWSGVNTIERNAINAIIDLKTTLDAYRKKS